MILISYTLKQEALAADLGVSQNVISKIEKESEIEEGLLNKIASHNDPEHALCDGPQSLKPEKYTELLKQVGEIAHIVGKEIK